MSSTKYKQGDVINVIIRGYKNDKFANTYVPPGTQGSMVVTEVNIHGEVMRGKLYSGSVGYGSVMLPIFDVIDRPDSARKFEYSENIDALIYSEAFTRMENKERVELIGAILDQMGVHPVDQSYIKERCKSVVEASSRNRAGDSE